MFERILVPLDGSSRAEAAVPVAARLARASGGRVLLVQVLSGPAEIAPYVAPVFAPSTLSADLDAATAYLGAVRAGILNGDEQPSIQVEFESQIGCPAGTIVSLVRKWPADLIVMCSHGHTGAMHRLMGSVAEHVTRRAPVPVLMLREGAPLPLAPAAATSPALTVLAPLDGAADSEAALGPATRVLRALAAPGMGQLHLVQVVPPAEADEQRAPGAQHGESAYLRTVADRLARGSAGRLGVRVTWSAVTASDAAAALITTATDAAVPYTLIAMATHSPGELRGWVLGSVADRVLHATRIPLLLVRAQETPATAAADPPPAP